MKLLDYKFNLKNILSIIIGMLLLTIGIFLASKIENNFEKISIFFILIFSVLFLIRGFKSIFDKKPFFPLDFLANSSKIKEPIITVDQYEIKCDYPSENKEEIIQWKKINKIKILTTDEGPYVCDVFVVLYDSKGNRVIIPQENEKCQLIIDRIFEFPNFDYKTTTIAMSSAENNWFEVWNKNW